MRIKNGVRSKDTLKDEIKVALLLLVLVLLILEKKKKKR